MGFVVTWILLAAFWLGLSGHFDATHLVFGFVSVTLVSALSHGHLTSGGSISRLLARTVRMLAYIPWLLWQILVANVDVMMRIFGLRDISPQVLRFRPGLEEDFGLVTLANSITLTPGTVTVDIVDGEFIVHALSREAARSLMSGAMERRVRVVEGRR